LQVLTSSQQQLITAQEKFLENIGSLSIIKGTEDGHEVMLPLTQTVYVKGTAVDPERVMIDIGTGYFAEYEAEDAIQYYRRKIEFLEEQVQMITKAAGEKKNQLMMIYQAVQQASKQQ
jgi:prefoldin alpha subunit